MATTPDKTKEVLSHKEFERALLAHRWVLPQVTEPFEQSAHQSLSERKFRRRSLIKSRFGQSAFHIRERKFKKSLTQLVNLRKQNRLSDEDFETLIYAVCTARIEQVAEVKVRQPIEEKVHNVFESWFLEKLVGSQ